MTILRLQYSGGKFISLDPIPGLQDGDEIEVEWKSPPTQPDAVVAMLDSTRGLWADWDDVEGLIEDARQSWDQAWLDKHSSL